MRRGLPRIEYFAKWDLDSAISRRRLEYSLFCALAVETPRACCAETQAERGMAADCPALRNRENATRNQLFRAVASDSHFLGAH